MPDSCDTKTSGIQALFVTQKGKSKIGRPKLPEAESRSIFVSTRLSPEEHKKITEAIRMSGKKKSDWLREALLEKIRH